jgi:hypothetical protein
MTQVKNQSLPDLAGMGRCIGFICWAFKDFWRSFCACRIPHVRCQLIFAMMATVSVLGYDAQFFLDWGIEDFYPEGQIAQRVFRFFLALSGYWGWMLLRVSDRTKFQRILDLSMKSIGLKNSLGNIPELIDYEPLEKDLIRLTLKRAFLNYSRLDEKRSEWETALNGYIDFMEEDRGKGTLTVMFSSKPMARKIYFDPKRTYKAGEFVIGMTRNKLITTTFSQTPHLLVAGLTGGGKSSWFRQFIVSLYLNSKDIDLRLVDLKGGLEFQLFAKLDRVTIYKTLETTTDFFLSLEDEMQQRMNLLESTRCKDIDAYNQKVSAGKLKGKLLKRQVIVIDEIAEVFMGNNWTNLDASQSCRKVLGTAARLGRALGINLAVGTQRPDARALDTQIKANMTGKVCFQMADTTSSVIVLNNKRAKLLPRIPGRAIWQSGLDEFEVQTPLLEPEACEKILATKRRAEKKAIKDPIPTVETPEKATIDQRLSHEKA